MMPQSICFVVNQTAPAPDIFSPNHVPDQNMLALAQAGWSCHILFAANFNTKPSSLPAGSVLEGITYHAVDQLLTGLEPDEDIPDWAFENQQYANSYRLALALRRLLDATVIHGIEFVDNPAAGYVAFKWRKLLGGPFAGLPMWVRLAQPPDNQESYSPQGILAGHMAHYALTHADQRLSMSLDPANTITDAYRQVLNQAATLNHQPVSSLSPPLVSIIVPHQDMPAYLDACLESVASNHYPHWELLLVDYGSTTPAASAKLQALEERYAAEPRFRILRCAAVNQGQARMAGIRQARGAYILTLDCDDLIAPDYLTVMVRALEHNPRLDGLSCFVSFFDDGRPPTEISGYVIPYDLNPKLIALENRAQVVTSLFRREVFNRLAYNAGFFAFEDWELAWQMARASVRQEAVPKILYRYRQRPDSNVRLGFQQKAELLSQMFELHAADIKDHAVDLLKLYAAALTQLRQRHDALERQIRQLLGQVDQQQQFISAALHQQQSLDLTTRHLLGLLRQTGPQTIKNPALLRQKLKRWVDYRLRGTPAPPPWNAAAAPTSDDGAGQTHAGADSTTAGPISSPDLAPETIFTADEMQWLEQVQAASPEAIALAHPEWRGVRSATVNLFPIVKFIDDTLDEVEARRLAYLLAETGCQRFVFGGFALSHQHLVVALNAIIPTAKIYVFWLGNFLQSLEDYNWRAFRVIQELCQAGRIYKWGFAKQGMAEIMAQTGLRTGFVMSMVNQIPRAPAKPLVGGPHLGVWSLGSNWRKPPYAMLAAALLIPGAVVHGSGADRRVREFAEAMHLNSKLQADVIPQSLMPAVLAQMHVNLYVTLSECAPMLPLESLSVGVPCLLGPNSHLFEDHAFLHKMLIVPYPDSSMKIAEAARQALESRAEIIEQYSKYAPEYNRRATASLAAFLEVD